jgi:hypothetical protein
MTHAAGSPGRNRCAGVARATGEYPASDLLPLYPVAEPEPLPPDPAWAGRLRRYGRYATWALPGYAVLAGLGVLDSSAIVAGLGLPDGSAVVAAGTRLLELVALTGLVGLLAGTRGTRWALAGMLAGFAGTVAPGSAGAIGAVAGWALLGVGVLRSRVGNRTDGWLLIVAAPALHLGGRVAPTLPLVGVLLLVAAGIGLAATGSRLLVPQRTE